VNVQNGLDFMNSPRFGNLLLRVNASISQIPEISKNDSHPEQRNTLIVGQSNSWMKWLWVIPESRKPVGLDRRSEPHILS
jgi:hypothetical protein